MIIYSRTALAQDTDGNLTRLITAGPKQDELLVKDLSGNEWTEAIYKELKR